MMELYRRFAVGFVLICSEFLEVLPCFTFSFQAFMSGKLKVKGNVMLLQKLQTVLDKKRKAKL